MLLLVFIIFLSCNKIIYNSDCSSTLTIPFVSNTNSYNSTQESPTRLTIDSSESLDCRLSNNTVMPEDQVNSRATMSENKSSIFSDTSVDSSEDVMLTNNSQHNAQNINLTHKTCLQCILGCTAIAVVVVIVNYFNK
jgi:hypothetical protein